MSEDVTVLSMGVGHSEDIDSEDAIAEAIAAAAAELGGRPARAGLLWSAVDRDYQLMLERVRERWPEIELIGCTTDGEMSSRLGFREDSLLLVLLGAERLTFRAAMGEGARADPRAAAKHAVEAARAALPEPARLCLTTPNSLGGSGAVITEALSEALGPDVAMVGGVAADQWRFEKTFQFANDKVSEDGVPVLLVSGPLRLAHGVACGWRPIGATGAVTDSEGGVVRAIDGEPALRFYERYFGPHIQPSSEYPLAVLRDEDFVLRTAVGQGDDGSVRFSAPVPVGSAVRLTMATRDEILAASQASFEAAWRDYPGTAPQAGLLVSCAARRQLLGTRAQEEMAALSAPPELPLAGFYAYGEISPRGRGPVEYHTETFVTLLLGEDDV